jgi:hypothetical protein
MMQVAGGSFISVYAEASSIVPNGSSVLTPVNPNDVERE